MHVVRVLVTGGAGFIGANLCRRLVTDGHRVTVIDDLDTGSAANLAGVDVELRRADIRDLDIVRSAARGVDAVVHLAALASVPRSVEHPVLTNEVNVNGTLNVLLAAGAADAHLIYASSSSVYGANEQLPMREDMRPEPRSPYAASKLAAESYVSAFQRADDLPAITFRLFNVYGPLQPAGHPYAAVIPSFVDALMRDRSLSVYGDGRRCRDFTSVESVVAVLAEAITRRVTSTDPVNLAFNTRTSILDLIALLEGVVGRPARVRHLPERVGDVRASQADSTRPRRLFPDVPPRDLRDGLAATVSWFQLSRSCALSSNDHRTGSHCSSSR
jgi:UDP-glucose 4-epimerase